ncbi:anhydro-N-acetylmuramic acid kinase [Thalassotalea sp. 1_MG-2023]|uniref:anhydro-N-acetylmuramic acid kinase n=1 Tax=Thalassotalea sp. 1_MG-2023 TaxID=3062680 RepID=UPI0026E17A4E|nr:anhydro-N-acetylmuramic acid kinase [Thalassotalea sp. 1_MG-2023]MDO6428161.1 anhydro-N-acetylmuramic acid kinase [Thalassotalea sp. 1_MG-2023]
MQRYYIGIMSGTSADGADLALVAFDEAKKGCEKIQLIGHVFHPYTDTFHSRVTSLYQPKGDNIDLMASLSVELAHFYHQAINALLERFRITREQIIAVGNHGQTIRHRPEKTNINAVPFTLQIGCNQTLACLSNLRVIGDFRTKDVALGGQGAPLVPAFHQFLFEERDNDTFIVNLGGIANITYLPSSKEKKVLGFDTGPANALLDAWCYKHSQQRHDKDGHWAASGNVIPELLTSLLADPYFAKPAPKSTGREYFTLDWLALHLNPEWLPNDIQATLAQLTATTIANEVNKLSPKSFVYLCGGGINNLHCYKLLKQQLKQHIVNNIHSLGLNNQAFEASAFAWLAYAYDKKIYNQIPDVTGASRQTILGIEFTP